MRVLNLDEVKEFVEENIGEFHKKRIERLGQLKLYNILKRKNPYLFRAKDILTAQELVESILDAYLIVAGRNDLWRFP